MRTCLSLILLCSVGWGCGGESECTSLKNELLDLLKKENPTLAAPKVVYGDEHRALVLEIRKRGCTAADLGAAPLLCYLGHPEESCPPGYTCEPSGPDVCRSAK